MITRQASDRLRVLTELVIGDTLAAGNASTKYNPGWLTFTYWNIQV